MTYSEWMEWIWLAAFFVDSLAWPVCTAALIIFVLRPSLREIVNLFVSIRLTGFGFKFKKSVEDVAEKAELLGSSWDAITLKPLPTPTELDPGFAVVRAWASVETAVGHLIESRKHELGQNIPKSTSRRIDGLLSANIIDQPLAGILRDMNGTRNMIAHGEDLALHYETVRLYEEIAAYVETIVEQLEESRPDSR